MAQMKLMMNRCPRDTAVMGGGASSSSTHNIGMVHDDDTHELDDAMEAWDDVKNERIDAELVRQARAEELAFMKKERVYTKVPIEQCHRTKGGSPTSVRWIDTNKGTKDKPNVRCRLVARDFNCLLYTSPSPRD